MNIPLPLRLLLWPFSVVYGVAARMHAWLYAQGIYSRKHLNAPVVSVGNLTVGGTGKTPMVLWLAEKFLGEHKRVAILTRGYRGKGGTSDEVAMMKERLGDQVIFGVGPDRYKEGKRIEAEHPVNLFLLDDGFQHLELIVGKIAVAGREHERTAFRFAPRNGSCIDASSKRQSRHSRNATDSEVRERADFLRGNQAAWVPLREL